MSTMKRFLDNDFPTKAYSYEISNIEILKGTVAPVARPNDRISMDVNSLLNGVTNVNGVPLLVQYYKDRAAEDLEWYYATLYAAERGDVRSLELLIDEGADINDFAMESEQSPLSVALENGRDDAALWILDHGAKLYVERYCCDVCNMTYSIGPEGLLEAAVTGGCHKSARRLMKLGANPDKPDCHGETPRQFAQRVGKSGFFPD